MVVIAIIIILAALAVPRVTKYVDDAKYAKIAHNHALMYRNASYAYTEFLAEGNKITGPNGTYFYVENNEVPDIVPNKVLTTELSSKIADLVSSDVVLKDGTINIGDDYLKENLYAVCIVPEDVYDEDNVLRSKKRINIRYMGYVSHDGVIVDSY
ncbi:MAG: hypothetical protein ACK5LV_03210 [Lachnospirales bacterium]